jgi:sugar phosphate permease
MAGKGRGFYWGWYVVLGAFLILGINYGIRTCFGIFVKPMAMEYQWSRSVISAGISIMVLVYGIGGIFTGRLIDRIAPRWLITAGAMMVAIGFFLTTLVQEPWQFFVTYGIFCGFGAACFGVVVCNSSVAKWFIRKRGLAIGIASIGIGVGIMVLAPLAGYVVKVYGWRAGFICLGLLVLIIGVAMSQWFMGRTQPEDYGLLPDGGDGPVQSSGSVSVGGPGGNISLRTILFDSRFWVLTICYSLAAMAEMSVLVHQVAYAIDRQIDTVAASSSLGMIGMASILGRFFFGWLNDRLRDAKYAAALGFLIMTGGIIILLKAGSAPILFVYAFVFGFGYGSQSVLMPSLLADRFGRHILGSAYGIMTFFVAGIGAGIGPVITGLVYDLNGSYTPAWIFNIAIFASVTFLILLMKPRRSDVVV